MTSLPISAPDAVLLLAMAVTYALGIACGLAMDFFRSRRSAVAVKVDDREHSWERVR